MTQVHRQKKAQNETPLTRQNSSLGIRLSLEISHVERFLVVDMAEKGNYYSFRRESSTTSLNNAGHSFIYFSSTKFLSSTSSLSSSTFHVACNFLGKMGSKPRKNSYLRLEFHSFPHPGFVGLYSLYILQIHGWVLGRASYALLL